MEKEKMKPVGEAGIIMELPESTVPADIFWDLIYAAGKTQLLKHAINFKVFNYLSKPISAKEIARKIETKPEPTSRLLDMLAILGVISKKDGQYRNTTSAEEYLMEGKPTYMGDMYTLMVDMWEGEIAQLPQILKSGFPEKAAGQAFSEDYWASLTNMNARCQRAVWPNTALPIIIELPEFSSFKRMLDLGGNAGIFTVALVSRHPTLKGTVLDQPRLSRLRKKSSLNMGFKIG
jgi:O-methyltransferase.